VQITSRLHDQHRRRFTPEKVWAGKAITPCQPRNQVRKLRMRSESNSLENENASLLRERRHPWSLPFSRSRDDHVAFVLESSPEHETPLPTYGKKRLPGDNPDLPLFAEGR